MGDSVGRDQRERKCGVRNWGEKESDEREREWRERKWKERMGRERDDEIEWKKESFFP